jgi:hypothetical protein
MLWKLFLVKNGKLRRESTYMMDLNVFLLGIGNHDATVHKLQL